MQQTTERLPQRAKQAGMVLQEAPPPADAQQVVWTDPAAVEQILFNLVDNACKYASSAHDRRIHIQWSLGNSVAQVRVTDHGPGIPPRTTEETVSPLFQDRSGSGPVGTGHRAGLGTVPAAGDGPGWEADPYAEARSRRRVPAGAPVGSRTHGIGFQPVGPDWRPCPFAPYSDLSFSSPHLPRLDLMRQLICTFSSPTPLAAATAMPIGLEPV